MCDAAPLCGLRPTAWPLGSKMKRNLIHITLLVLMLSVFSPVQAEGQKISGIYSNLHFNEEGGDLLGMEVFLFPSGPRSELAYSAFVQIAEGGAPYGVVVQVSVANGHISFSLPAGSVYAGMKFNGIFTDSELVLTDNNGNKEHLKHGNSYWQ